MSDIVAEHIIDTVARLAAPIFDDLGLELVEVQFRREQVGWVLRLVIYRPTGVTVDDCVTASREVGRLLDVEDLIEQPYHLEVSSPGLDRPLKTPRDFARYQGQKVKVVTNAPIKGQHVITGLIEQAGEAGVTVTTEEAEEDRIAIPYERIAKAKLVIEF